MKLFKLILIFVLLSAGFLIGFETSKSHSKSITRSSLIPTGFAKLQNLLVKPVFASSPPTAINALRSGFFLIGGYPDRATWEALNPDYATEGAPPQIGLLGIMGGLIDGIATIAVTNGISSCEAVPSTGSYTGSITLALSTSVTVSGTLTFETPTKSIPSSWTSGGTAYAKRAKFTSDSYNAAVEFTCSRSSAWASMSIPGDSISGSTRVLNLYWDVEDSAASKFEMAMKVTHSSSCGTPGDTCDSQLLRATTGASNQFSLWSAYFAYRSPKYQSERILMNGNTSTGEFTSYYKYDSDEGANLAAVSGTADDHTEGSPAVDFQQTTTSDFVLKGCLDLDTPTTNPGSTSDCTSYSLSAPAATIFTGSGSPGFSLNGLKDLVANITAP